MGDAKRIIVRPIPACDANRIIRALHYSGKIVPNSQVHLGVFLDGRCGGAMQFGPSIDIRRVSRLVHGTAWHNFLELNRLAFADWLPRNGESRALAFALRWIARTYPHVEWIVSFADATQSGDGCIYRATGFVLTGIKRNTQILQLPNGSLVAKKTLDNPNHRGPNGEFGSAIARRSGATFLPGFQLRYVYFINRQARNRLAVPILPFSDIDRVGAAMYLGQSRERSRENAAAGPPAEGGVIPTRSLHSPEAVS